MASIHYPGFVTRLTHKGPSSHLQRSVPQVGGPSAWRTVFGVMRIRALRARAEGGISLPAPGMAHRGRGRLPETFEMREYPKNAGHYLFDGLRVSAVTLAQDENPATTSTYVRHDLRD
jgi:hypothetical protein